MTYKIIVNRSVVQREVWRVEATSPDEASSLFWSNDAEFIEEEMVDAQDPEIIEIRCMDKDYETDRGL